MHKQTLDQRSFTDNFVTFIKYLLAAALVIAASQTKTVLLSGLLQIAVVFLLTDVLVRISKYFQILNYAAMLFINTEYAVMYFANSFITLTMLQNLNSLEDLSGKAAQYVIGVMAVVFISGLPVKPIGSRTGLKSSIVKTVSALVIQVIVLYWFGSSSAISAAVKVYKDYRVFKETKDVIDYQNNDHSDNEYRGQNTKFYKSEVSDCINKPEQLADQPNIILVFTEGLSSNIISDERNIMPNLAAAGGESLNFTNYFNHTFATYHALQGQLFSGYQFNNNDKNNLVSIQKVLQQQNYKTYFINTEPTNSDFSAYLEDMEFDEVLSSDNAVSVASLAYLSDKDAYSMLLSTAKDMNTADSPFFIGMYTFGTHVSLDSPDEVFEDGHDPLLNKFYNLDYQFGKFLEEFKKSELFDNTIFIFTADHATYQDQDFSNAFPGYGRAITVVDEMPLLIYHKDIIPETIDVHGKTSINLVPTILDYLDISAENFFLGDSLFNTSNTEKDLYVSWNPEYAVSTFNGEIAWFSDSDMEELNKMLQEYFVACNYDETDDNEITSGDENNKEI